MIVTIRIRNAGCHFATVADRHRTVGRRALHHAAIPVRIHGPAVADAEAWARRRGYATAHAPARPAQTRAGIGTLTIQQKGLT